MSSKYMHGPSSIYSSSENENRNIWVDDIGSDSIDRVTKLLAGIPKGAKKALSSALKRASSSGEAFAARAVRKEFYVSASDFKQFTKSARNIVSTANGTEISIKYYGTHIPLIRFDTHIDKDGRVTSRVMRSSARQTLNNAFSAKFGSITGVYERKSESRFPLRQLYGPAVAQMIDNNDDIVEAIGEHIKNTFEKRAEHEILRVLNGWEGKI